MVYTRMGNGALIIRSKIEDGDVVTQCDCGGELVAMDLDEDGDVVACCDTCAEWSNWLHEEPRELFDNFEQPASNVISLDERRLACR